MVRLERFSTKALASEHRHEAWVARGGAGIGRLVDARPDGSFDMWSEYLALGPLGVSFGEMTAQHYERTVERCRHDQVDMVSFCLMLKGAMSGEADNEDFVAKPGGLALFDLAKPARHHSTKSQTVMITMQREIALARFGSLHRLHGAVADSTSTRLLRNYLSALHVEARQRLDLKVRPPLGEAVLNLLEVSLVMAGHVENVSADARQNLLKLRAIDEIERRLDLPDLDIDYLCRRLSISRSALYRLFEMDGGVHAFIRNARLNRIHAILSRPDERASVADLAAGWNFYDEAHLNRAFRERYGLLPNKLRRKTKAE